MATNLHKPLNTKQLAILDIFYRFRFITSTLLAKQLHLTQSTVNEKLSILVDQEYIGRKYETAYRLRGQPASYHLLPKGIAALRQAGDDYQRNILKNMYRDQTASDAFVTHWLDVFETNYSLMAKLGDNLQTFTKSQLAKYKYFPQPLPDLFLRHQNKEYERQYFLDVIDSDTMTFLAQRRVKEYVGYAESGEWEANVNGYPLPVTILICESKALSRNLQRYVSVQMEEYFEDDLVIEVTSKEGVAGILDPKR